SFGHAGPYFPPALGEEILKNKILYKETFYIPNNKYHFLSLIYHITYHKAEKSGLPLDEKTGPLYKESDHNYISVLKGFSQTEEFDNNINLMKLHNYLKKKNI